MDTFYSKVPFSARARGKHQQIDKDFPISARTGLLHLLHDLVRRNYVDGWLGIARELNRIARNPIKNFLEINGDSEKKIIAEVENTLYGLEWGKVFDFCERIYDYLAVEVRDYEINGRYYDVIESLGDVRNYIAIELQRLFIEEDFAYEFLEGKIQRRGRKHTVELVSKSQVVLADPRLLEARKHFDKSLRFFRDSKNPDYENAVKEAVCAVEAAGKSLFPMAQAKTLGDLVKWFNKSTEINFPPGIGQCFTGIYTFRNGGEGVSHGGANGGKVTPEACEHVVAICASQIIFLVDLENISYCADPVPF